MQPNISDFQRQNLLTLARYLWDLPQLWFDMEFFQKTDSCHTIGCALGHGPSAGILKLEGEEWLAYGNRAFNGRDCDGYFWIFRGTWGDVDNTPRGAAKRILCLLRHGLPQDWEDQNAGLAPLSYLNEPLDLITPAQPLLASSVEACMAESP